MLPINPMCVCLRVCVCQLVNYACFSRSAVALLSVVIFLSANPCVAAAAATFDLVLRGCVPVLMPRSTLRLSFLRCVYAQKSPMPTTMPPRLPNSPTTAARYCFVSVSPAFLAYDLCTLHAQHERGLIFTHSFDKPARREADLAVRLARRIKLGRSKCGEWDGEE